MNSQHILTPEGLKKVKQELEELKSKRSSIIERIAKAKEMGDLTENAEYHAAREEQSFNEGRIQELEFILKNSKVVTVDTASDYVTLGSTVNVEDEKQKITYSIVGSNEASIKENKISIDSPMAKALLGKKVGEECEVEAPSGIKKYKIISIM